MAAFGRPVATGRVIGDRQIEVSFPDDATFTGVIDNTDVFFSVMQAVLGGVPVTK
jgi:hypothetical protein